MLDTNFDCATIGQVKREVELLRELRPNLNRYVYHTSLNFPPEDEALLSDEKLVSIAHDYMEANGFDNNQYLVFRHYDAGHPHLHLLVNRIRFDGSVVSDSNNYKKSEDILRELERQYHLTTVAPSREVKQRAAKKDEIEMVIRTGKPSEKMLLQEKLTQLLNQRQPLTLQSLIRQGEAQGIRFLFNQASTGRVTGITYYHDGFKIKGKVLGNRFKWSELLKTINYEQIGDSQAVSQANSRTRAVYGDLSGQTGSGQPAAEAGSDRLHQRYTAGPANNTRQPAAAGQPGEETYSDGTSTERTGAGRTSAPGTSSQGTGPDADLVPDSTPDFDYNRFDRIDFEITDDEDDDKYRRRSRWPGR